MLDQTEPCGCVGVVRDQVWRQQLRRPSDELPECQSLRFSRPVSSELSLKARLQRPFGAVMTAEHPLLPSHEVGHFDELSPRGKSLFLICHICT